MSEEIKMAIYDFTVKDIKGEEVSLNEYKGKLLLIVNTATGCGFTPQYNGLETLYEKYREKGFEILDFPCNQFANQAPGTNEQIQDFCQVRFKITFKQFAKINVNGQEEAPLYTFLKKEQPGVIGAMIKWNFTKFMVDRTGKVLKRYAPATPPELIEKDIKKLLEE
jgi:glutathione peroxidase